MIYMHAAAGIAGAVLAGVLAWNVQGWRMGEHIAAIQAKHAEATAKAQSDARATEKALSDKLQEAQNNATKREAKLRSDAAASRRTADGLRDTLHSFSSELPSASLDACRHDAAALASVLADVERAGRDMAEAADRHASDSLMYQEAWPK